MDSIKQAHGYRFDREDQSIYLSRDLLEFVPRCQWPEVQLPVPQVVPQPVAPAPSANEELLKGLQPRMMQQSTYFAPRILMLVKYMSCDDAAASPLVNR